MNPHLPLIVGNAKDEHLRPQSKQKESRKRRSSQAGGPVVLPTPPMTEHQEFCNKVEEYRAHKEFMDELARNRVGLNIRPATLD